MTLTIVGSSGYAPLEQYWGKAVPASDLYGLASSMGSPTLYRQVSDGMKVELIECRANASKNNTDTRTL
jgi:serine/threonine protein kinase